MEKELNADGLLKILEDREGVSGYVVFNYEGIPMRYTMEHEKAVQYAALISDFLGVTKKIINKELMKDQNPAEVIFSIISAAGSPIFEFGRTLEYFANLRQF